MATISVIIPVYNTAPYLRECVDSVISQTFADTQIILVDDGSDDGSAGICDEYADRFDNVSVIHKSNGGLSEARNVGMAASHGEYTFFLDSDDRIVPDTLETLLGLLNGYDADIATARHIYWYDNAAVPARAETAFDRRIVVRHGLRFFEGCEVLTFLEREHGEKEGTSADVNLSTTSKM